jgi:NAD+ diphosphatase
MLQTPAHFTSLLARQAHEAPLNFVFRGDELLVGDGDLALPDSLLVALLGLQPGQFQPLGLLGGQYCQTAWLPKSTAAPDGYAFRKLRALFGAMDEARLAIAGRAFQISDWARTHQFCGACGSPKQQMQGERCMKCAACGHLAYPRISPAMMVLVRRGSSILLARNALSPMKFFSALAGFVEAGESIEETIHREVDEEVGLKVRDIRYFGSQPWPFPHSLMIAYTAEYDGGDIRVDETEIAEARWFGPGDAMPPVPPVGISIAGALIQAHLP